MVRPRETVGATVFAAAVRVEAPGVRDVGAVVAGQDRFRGVVVKLRVRMRTSPVVVRIGRRRVGVRRSKRLGGLVAAPRPGGPEGAGVDELMPGTVTKIVATPV